MPLILNPDEARRFLETDEAPAPHLDMLNAASFRTAGAAMRLGVFDALAGGPATGKELGARLGVDERGLGQLLAALVSFGYLSRGADGFASTPRADKWLRSGPGSYATVFSFWQTVLFELWADLERSVRDGEPAIDFYHWLEQRPQTMREFQTMLSRLATSLCREVVEAMPLPEPTHRLLDIGGGHASYAIAYCQRHPELTATVLDLPAALAVGAEAVDAAGLSDRIALRPGDLHTARFEQEFDAALLFNIVHGLRPESVAGLLRVVAGALRPGGVVALLEPLSDLADGAGAVGEAFVRMFSLNLFHGQGGQVYGFDELAGWLGHAGFVDVRRHRFATSPTDHLVFAVRS